METLIRITSKKSPRDLLESIRKSCNEHPMIDWTLDDIAIDKMKGNKFRLYRRIPNFRNSFKPFFYGEVHQAAQGSEIIGKFAMRPFTKAFLFLWISGLACSPVYAVFYYRLNDHETWRLSLFTGLFTLCWNCLIGGFGLFAYRKAETAERESKPRIVKMLEGCAATGFNENE